LASHHSLRPLGAMQAVHALSHTPEMFAAEADIIDA
jgi:hypothetical protein